MFERELTISLVVALAVASFLASGAAAAEPPHLPDEQLLTKFDRMQGALDRIEELLRELIAVERQGFLRHSLEQNERTIALHESERRQLLSEKELLDIEIGRITEHAERFEKKVWEEMPVDASLADLSPEYAAEQDRRESELSHKADRLRVLERRLREVEEILARERDRRTRIEKDFEQSEQSTPVR